MANRQVDVDGIRRVLNVSPEEMSDHDIRRALAILAADYDPDRAPQEVAEGSSLRSGGAAVVAPAPHHGIHWITDLDRGHRPGK